jgi:glycosyltransferase involved in cell wall biosynthesis
MSKSISVVIPTYNYGRFIDAAIESALNQTEPASEIIIVDDGSIDDTAEIVRRYDGNVRYIRQENQGVCSARNRGVKESNSELVAFLDADDFWEPTILERQRSCFEADSEIGLVHTGMREFDGDTGETIRLHLEGGEDGVADNLLLWEGPVIVGPGGTVMVTRKAFDEVGGFDTRMKVGEDWDFCYRIARRYKVGFVAEPLVNYRSHAGAAHRNIHEMERGMLLFYEKAFEKGSDVLKLKRRSYGNFHRVLAGSYFQSGDYARFIAHAVRSLINRPAALKYFLGFPFRRLRKKSY